MIENKVVILRFSPENKKAVVDEIMNSYAIEASTKINFPAPYMATIVLPSGFIAKELINEARSSSLCYDAYLQYSL